MSSGSIKRHEVLEGKTLKIYVPIGSIKRHEILKGENLGKLANEVVKIGQNLVGSKILISNLNQAKYYKNMLCWNKNKPLCFHFDLWWRLSDYLRKSNTCLKTVKLLQRKMFWNTIKDPLITESFPICVTQHLIPFYDYTYVVYEQ